MPSTTARHDKDLLLCRECESVYICVLYKMRCYFPYPASHEAARDLYISGTVNKCKQNLPVYAVVHLICMEHLLFSKHITLS